MTLEEFKKAQDRNHELLKATKALEEKSLQALADLDYDRYYRLSGQIEELQKQFIQYD